MPKRLSARYWPVQNFRAVSAARSYMIFFFFSSRRRHTSCLSDWSSDVCSSDLFLHSRLAINIDSLTVGPTENEEIARMTIVAHTDERGAHRLEASLEKLVDVLLARSEERRVGKECRDRWSTNL